MQNINNDGLDVMVWQQCNELKYKQNFQENRCITGTRMENFAL
jgi:hypothetical protein